MIVRDKYTGATLLRLGNSLDREGELEVVAESNAEQFGICIYLDREQLERVQRHITYVLEKCNG